MTFTRANLFRLTRGGGGAPTPPGEVPYIVPGGGWGGDVTETPPANGEPGAYAYAAGPYGRPCGNIQFADLTDDQEVTLNWHFFHPSSDERFALTGKQSDVVKVEVACDNGEWFEAPEVLDERANPPEWVNQVKLRRADFPRVGKLHEVRVRVHVADGQNRVLQGDVDGPFPGYFFTPNDGSLFGARRMISKSLGVDTNDGLTEATPKLTLRSAKEAIFAASGNTTVGGGLIDIIDGDYTLGDATENFDRSSGDRWLTIRRHPASAPEAVSITGAPFSGAGLRVTKIRLKNLRLGGLATFSTNSGLNARILCEDCDANGPGQQYGGDIPGGLLGVTWKAAYWHGGTYLNYPAGLKAWRTVSYAVMDAIGEDAYSNSPVVYACTVSNINRGSHAGGSNAWHPDVAALPTAPTENFMWYGITADQDILAQGIFGDNNATATVTGMLVQSIRYAKAGEDWRAFTLARTSTDVSVIDCEFGPGTITFDDGMPPGETVTDKFNPTRMTMGNVTSTGNVVGRDHPQVKIRGGNI